jgi:transcriptional activator SPT7
MEVDGQSPEPPKDKKLLTLMNANIRTLKRIRVTHAKFAALEVMSAQAAGEDGEGGEGQAPAPIMLLRPQAMEEEDAETDKLVDERPWKVRGRGIRGGLMMGRENSDDCLNWMSKKVLEHVGFQGATESTLSVLTGVAGDYLMKLATTMQFLVERSRGKMTREVSFFSVLSFLSLTQAGFDIGNNSSCIV